MSNSVTLPDLKRFPALRMFAAGAVEERRKARAACCVEYGRELVDRGKLYTVVQQELTEFALQVIKINQ